MAVTFYAAGDPKGPLADLALILSNDQATEFLQWLGLPSGKLQGSMWAADLVTMIRSSLAPTVVDAARDGQPVTAISPLKLESAGAKSFAAGRPRGAFRDWARRLLQIAERAGSNYVAWS
jgi:hypothetical protein